MKGYMTVKQAAEKWNVSVRSIQAMCAEGKIPDASKMSNVWVIPEDAAYPIDGRLKNGNYVNWRKNDKE